MKVSCKFGEERETLLDHLASNRKRTQPKSFSSASGLPEGTFRELLWCGVPNHDKSLSDMWEKDSLGRVIFYDSFCKASDTVNGHLVLSLPEDSKFGMAWGPVEIDDWDERSEVLHQWRFHEEVQPRSFPLIPSFGDHPLSIPSVMEAIVELSGDPEFMSAIGGEIKPFVRSLSGLSSSLMNTSDSSRIGIRMVLAKVLPTKYKNPAREDNPGWETRAISALSLFNVCFGVRVSERDKFTMVSLYPQRIVDRIEEQLEAGCHPLIPQWAGWSKDTFHGGLTKFCAGSTLYPMDAGGSLHSAESKLYTSVTSLFSSAHSIGNPHVLLRTPPDEWFQAYDDAHDWLLAQDLDDLTRLQSSDVSLVAARKIPFWMAAKDDEDSKLGIIRNMTTGMDSTQIEGGEYVRQPTEATVGTAERS